MSKQTIDGKNYAQMLLGGANALLEHAQEVNDLNVFPVPDGDTGTNMAKTLEGGISKLANEDAESIGAASKSFADGVLLGARGNSGVILSQIFAGINEELSKYDSIDAKGLAEAYKHGIAKSYSAVQNPTEGTILTVFRESTEYAAQNITDDSTIEDFFELHIEKARESLAQTKEILPQLQEADVVDSGGAGYLYIAIGMYEVLTGKTLPKYNLDQLTEKAPTIDIDMFTRDSVLEFGYCTEFLLRLTTNKVDPDNFDIEKVLSILNELGGESIVAYQTGDIVKVHVHTFTPGLVLARVQEFGEFLTVKIENMSLGHSGTPEKKISNGKKFSVLTVASGEGMCSLFMDMGADQIVAGGQSANPSTEEFIEAFKKCDTPDILVMPNNKNVFLAANQAAEIYTDARVHIIPTKSLMQGYGALSVITPGVDVETLVESATRAAQSVVGSEITKAVRNVTINGKEIKEGDYIAITNGEINVVTTDLRSAVLGVFEDVDMDDYEIITLFVGKNVEEDDRAELTEEIEELYPDCEVIVYEGGQDVYDYLIAIE